MPNTTTINNQSPAWENSFDEYLQDRKVSSPFQWQNAEIKSHILSHPENWIGLCLEKELVSFILFSQSPDVVEINYLETEGLHLKLGYMEKLFSQLLSQFPQKKLWLDVHQDNLPAIKMYQKLGFALNHCRENYYKDGAAALLMSREASQGELF